MLNWKNLKLSGDSAKALEALASDADFNNFIGDAINSREDAVKQSVTAEFKGKISEFRDSNIAQDQKLKAFDGVDADEYHRLKKLGSGAKDADKRIQELELDYKAQLGAKDTVIAESKKANEELTLGRQQDGFRVEMNSAISNYNAQNPTMKIAGGAEKQVIREALDNYKIIGEKYVMQSNGEDFKGDGGFGTMTEWISNDYIPKNKYVVERSGGAGAGGSSLNGSSGENLTSVQKITAGLQNR